MTRRSVRVWIFNHKITGTIFLHAERLGLLPSADAVPNNSNTPKSLERISYGRASKSIKPKDNRRWRIKYSKKESAWARQQKFCTPATLSWTWSYDGNSLIHKFHLIHTFLEQAKMMKKIEFQ